MCKPTYKAYLIIIGLSLLGTLPGCSSKTPSEHDTDDPGFFTAVGYTHHQADGNRIVYGTGYLPDIDPVDIGLPGIPRWIAAVPFEEGSLWAVVMADGSVQAYTVMNGNVIAAEITPDRTNPDTPPLLVMNSQGSPKLLSGIHDDASPMTSPVVLDSVEGLYAYVDMLGDLVITDGLSGSRVTVDALPDTPVLTDGNGRILVLTGPTDRYNHGVTGDGIEAGGIKLVETEPVSRIVTTITIPTPHVIEGNSLLWADITGDGNREIIVTLSDSEQGAWLNVYSEEGEHIAAGPSIGRGFRWRHQIAVAPFAVTGDIEIVAVKTPHIGGIVEFYQITDDSLHITTTLGEFTSHEYRSGNLDMAAAGDFDGDGIYELLLPDLSMTHLSAVRRTQDSADVIWSVPAGGSISTNLGAVTLFDGSIVAGIGHDGQVLRLWIP